MSTDVREIVIDSTDREQLLSLFPILAEYAGKVRIAIRPYKPKRSLRANAFYWAAVVPAFVTFMRHKGQYFEKEEVHEFFLQMFASREVIDPDTGEILSLIGRRSSKMDSGEFSLFVNNCIGWMVDRFRIPMPEPDYLDAITVKRIPCKTIEAAKPRGLPAPQLEKHEYRNP